MSTALECRRAAMRVLYEAYGAPTALLAEVARIQESTLQGIARKAGWSRSEPQTLRAELLAAMRVVVRQMTCADTEPAQSEKSARALMAIARTIEELANAQSTMAGEAPEDDGSVKPSYVPMDDATYARFERAFDSALAASCGETHGLAMAGDHETVGLDTPNGELAGNGSPRSGSTDRG